MILHSSPHQLQPQPLHFVKQTPARRLTRRPAPRRPSGLHSYQQKASQFGPTTSSRASPAFSVPSPINASGVITAAKRTAFGLEAQDIISQKPSDTPLKVRKVRGRGASGSDSAQSIASNSSYVNRSNPITSYTGQEADAISVNRSIQCLPRSSSVSLENVNPGLHSQAVQSASSLGERAIIAAGGQITPKQIKSSPRITPKRRTSTKRRVLTKMFGGFQTKSKTPPRQRSGQSESSLFRRLSGRSESTDTSRSKSPATVAPSTETLITSQSTYNLLESPQTPRSDRVTSAPPPSPSTSSEVGLPNAGTSSQSVLPLIKPEYPPLLHLELNFIAEVESLDCKSERKIWVAIEGRGAADPPISGTRKRQLGLDVVIVIDNSHTSSQECLDNAHKNVILLAELLNRPNDRLAVFCTHCQHQVQDSENLTGCHLHPLQEPCVQSLREELQSIKDRPILPFRQSPPLDEAVGAAIRVLSQSASSRRESLRDGATHVFVFSATPADCLHIIPDFPFVHIHLVNPSSIPFPIQQASLGAWTMSTLITELDNWSVLNVDAYEDVSDRLRQTILHARNGAVVGNLTDIKIKITQKPGCGQEGVIGESFKAVVRHDQRFTLVVRLRVAMASTGTPLPQASPDPKEKARPRLEDAMAELESCLGEVEVPLFTVQATYRHSLLPENSFIVTEKTCKILKTDSTAIWSLPATATTSPQADNAKTELYKRLAFFIATRSTPKEALKEFDTFFKHVHHVAACPEFVSSVRNELHHQILVISYRASIASSTKSSSTTFENPFPCLGRFSFEANEKQQNYVLGLELSRYRSASDSPATVIHQRTTERITEHTEPDSSVDEAAQIWRHMRRDSKSRRRLRNGSHESLERMQSADDHLRELRKKAIQNKRSIGADTLRSLSMALTIPTTPESGGSVPWL
ncbi:uncharacterized protein BDZ99DRAFT_497039 [Mytilinidion resinicola]|uniref:Uncharacterized protein n=1 Tax=Mytilinidion resinicola TaxID=574789 RepID=A0A6A6YXF8_9PEZI|nr:uncharacterized protein BDZ99DRAFT_497039 [Mytilinidion resinicola]KAF2812674.1 hypothetical protein BDZ99DRAFT_497039 [Mytilinidion resinicola]